MSYDHADRLQTATHKLGANAAVTLAQYTYDEVGRVKTRKVHGTAETLTYNYNVRNWLTQITGGKFNETLTYNVTVNGVTPATARFGGDISDMKWKAGTETTERGYQFTYDPLNRMKTAAYGEGSGLASNTTRFNVSVTYNKMGSILTLQRPTLYTHLFQVVSEANSAPRLERRGGTAACGGGVVESLLLSYVFH